MAVTHLADTSVLTRLGSAEVRAVVEPLAATGLLARTTMSDLEIGHSGRTAAEFDALSDALEVLDLVEIDATDFTRARQVQRQLAAAGLRGRKVPDLLIAAAAERHGLAVVHYDRDFDHIAAVTGQRTQWVVPAGGID